MSEKYTYADVIIDPADPRVEIGEKYYFALRADACIDYANRGVRINSLDAIDTSGGYYPFITDEKDYPFIIRKKKEEKHYAPFNLSKEEDRARLRGAWIRVRDYPNIEYQIISMNAIYVFCDAQKEGISPEVLLTSYEFVDGSPCGRLVEEE